VPAVPCLRSLKGAAQGRSFLSSLESFRTLRDTLTASQTHAVQSRPYLLCLDKPAAPAPQHPAENLQPGQPKPPRRLEQSWAWATTHPRSQSEVLQEGLHVARSHPKLPRPGAAAGARSKVRCCPASPHPSHVPPPRTTGQNRPCCSGMAAGTEAAVRLPARCLCTPPCRFQGRLGFATLTGQTEPPAQPSQPQAQPSHCSQNKAAGEDKGKNGQRLLTVSDTEVVFGDPKCNSDFAA